MKTNKIWNIIMMFVLGIGIAFVFTSCGKDDEDSHGSSSAPSGLVGTWTHNNGNWTYTITFKSNGTFSMSKSSKNGSSGGHEGTYRVSGTTVSCTGPYWTVYVGGDVDKEDSRTITYTYSNGILNDGDYQKR